MNVEINHPQRLLKNARLSRASRDSPYSAVVAAFTVGNGLKPFPTKDFGRLASACLPKPRRRQEHF
jgi:hypothetical protein